MSGFHQMSSDNLNKSYADLDYDDNIEIQPKPSDAITPNWPFLGAYIVATAPFKAEVSKFIFGVDFTKNYADDIADWLGEVAPPKKNPAGDPIFISKDGQRKVRWDWNGKGNDIEHIHFEILGKNGKWKDAVNGKHRIYFKGK